MFATASATALFCSASVPRACSSVDNPNVDAVFVEVRARGDAPPEGWDMDNPPRIGLPVEALACSGDAVLSTRPPCNHPLNFCGVRCVRASSATSGWSRAVGVEDACHVHTSSAHLQRHLRRHRGVSAICSPQHNVAKTEVVAAQRWQFTRVQQAANAAPHGRTDARRSLMVSKLRHNVWGV